MNARVPFLDLRVLDDAQRGRLLKAIERVLLHGRLINGPEVLEFENRMATACGRSHAAGVNSGTDALFLALKALGIGPGDEVITTSLSWVATANAIALTGAVPVFADIRDDLNIDPDSVRELISPRVRAIVPVHYSGKVCAMEQLAAIAREHGIHIVEDAAQAFGATLHGRPAGSFGILAAFSMNSMKVLASCGEAGCVVTDDAALRDRLEMLRYNGTVNRETCLEPSLNGRLDTIQAAILLERLNDLDNNLAIRRRNAELYSILLEGFVDIPEEGPGERDVFYSYIIRTQRRDELMTYLAHQGIETKVQHPVLMPNQPAYSGQFRASTARASVLVKQILSLPVSEKTGEHDVRRVAQTIRQFMGAA